MKVRPYFPTTITVDDEGGEGTREVAIQVKRLTLDEAGVFRRGFDRMNDPPSNRLIHVRRDDRPDEQDCDDRGRYTLGLDVIAQRRIGEMTAEQRAAHEEQDVKDEAFSKQFIVDAISKYVTVPDGQLEDEDDRPVRTGVDLLRVYGGNYGVLQQTMLAVYIENTMTAHEKKVAKSLFALKRSFSQRVPAAVGPTQEPTADAVEPAASADSADATAEAQTPSGLGGPIVH